MSNRLDPEFLKILVCPVSHAPLVQDGDTLVSTDPKTRRRYRIVSIERKLPPAEAARTDAET